MTSGKNSLAKFIWIPIFESDAFEKKAEKR